jgi:hypothetical protein
MKSKTENRRAIRPQRRETPQQKLPSLGTIYGMACGARRRKLLLEWLAVPEENCIRRICVNRRWQANLVDPDLQYLLKKGLLVQHRDGGGRRHPLNRSSHTRQSYLVLANAA